MDIMKEITVRFHEGQCILMPEKISVSAIAMAESKDRQIKFGLGAIYKKNHFTPVKFDNTARLIR